jgi:hypothetical protein
MVRILPVLLSTLFLGGCVTPASIRSAPLDAGMEGTYRAPVEKVKQLSLEALGEASFTLQETSHLETGSWLLLARHEPATGTGHIARIVVEPHERETFVRILVRSTKSNSESDSADAALAQSIHERLARKLGELAPAPAGTPGKTVDVGIERMYRSPLPVCFDAAMKVFRDRDYRVPDPKLTGESGTLLAEGRGYTLSLGFTRTPADQTRVIIHAVGRGLQENRDESKSFLDQLRKALLEPGD